MKPWPGVAVVALSGTVLCALIAVQQTYVRTKAAWYAQGNADGSIRAQIELVDHLRRSGRVVPCPARSAAPRHKLVSIKAEAIYMVRAESGVVLCE